MSTYLVQVRVLSVYSEREQVTLRKSIELLDKPTPGDIVKTEDFESVVARSARVISNEETNDILMLNPVQRKSGIKEFVERLEATGWQRLDGAVVHKE